MALIKKAKGKNWYWQFKYTDITGTAKTKTISTGISSDLNSEKAKSKARKIGLQKQDLFMEQLHTSKELAKHGKRVSHSSDTLAIYSKYWLSEMKGSVEDNTLASYEAPLRTHILPLIGDFKLNELDQFDLKDFINAELADCENRQAEIDQRIEQAHGKKVSIKNTEKPYFYSIKKHLDIIKMMLDYAVSENDLQENVVKKSTSRF